jgi:hypothetical protein
MTETGYFKTSQAISETSSTSGELSLLSRTLLIFDFDDTLFCTKYFDTFSLPYKDIFTCRVSLEEINPCLIRELKQLESSIIDLFSGVIQNYDIVIISNADMTWINNVLTHFLEELKEYINENDIKIYSAKNMFSKFSKNKTDWKIKCFKKVIKEIYKNDLTYTELNIISIGDGNEEKKAVFSLSKINNFHKINQKFIRCVSYPSAATIILQLNYLNNNLNNMVFENNSIYKMSIEFKNDKPEIKCISSKKNKNEDILKNYLNDNNIEETSTNTNTNIYLNENDKQI